MPGGFPAGWEICNGTDQGTATGTSTGVSLTSSSTAGTYGSYTQIVASSAIDACFVEVNLIGGPFNFSNNLMLKIAVGAAASEIDIIKDLMFYNGSTSALASSYFFPVAIPAATRISAAVAPQVSNVDALITQVTLYDGSFSQIEGCAGIDSIGLSSTHGTTVTAGATNTKGSYAQLSASTPRDYLGFCFALDANGSSALPGTSALIDIAIGGAGSEVVVVPNFLYRNGGLSTPTGNISPLYPIQIPAGTRVAARFQNTAGSGNMGITLYGIYQ